MDPEKQARLERAGFTVDDYAEFLGLTEAEKLQCETEGKARIPAVHPCMHVKDPSNLLNEITEVISSPDFAVYVIAADASISVMSSGNEILCVAAEGKDVARVVLPPNFKFVRTYGGGHRHCIVCANWQGDSLYQSERYANYMAAMEVLCRHPMESIAFEYEGLGIQGRPDGFESTVEEGRVVRYLRFVGKLDDPITMTTEEVKLLYRIDRMTKVRIHR